MDKKDKAKLLELIQNGTIKIQDLRKCNEEPLCGNMFIKNDGEGKGYTSSAGPVTDKEFEDYRIKMLGADRKRELLGLPVTIYMVVS